MNVHYTTGNKRPIYLELPSLNRPSRANNTMRPAAAAAAVMNGTRSPSPRRTRSPNTHNAQPRETDRLINNTSKPPMANNEVDEFDKDERETVDKPYPGVDDGFFSGGGANGDEIIPVLTNRAGEDEHTDGPTNSIPISPTNHFPERPFPRYPESEFGTRTDMESIPDVNVYQQKKTLAQGMMDLALFSANANQLRYVLESVGHPYYYPGLIMIGFSLILQVLVGVGLIWNSRYNVKDKKEICVANKINNFTIIGIFLVTVINVFISAFGTTSVVATAQSFPVSTRAGVMTDIENDPK